MAIYPDKRGWGVDWRDEFGRRHRKHVGTEVAARRMDSELHSAVGTHRAAMKNFRTAEVIDLLTARDLYITHASIANSTKVFQSERLGRLANYLGNIPVADLTPQRLDEYVKARRMQLAPSSLARECQLIKTMCAWLVRSWYLPVSPADHLISNIPRQSAGRAISYEEELRILQSCTERIRTKLLTAIDAGLRRGECNALRKNHLNLAEGTITTFSTKTRTFRTVPMTPRLQVALDSISNTLAPDALLFGFAGREVKKGSDALKRIRNKARVGFRFHDLRHTFATRLQAATTNPAIVRDMLGHAPRTSTDLYLHPPLAECREAIMKMAEQTTAGLQAASRVN